MSLINTCRFCKKTASEDWLVKYGRRHYAHPTCYIKAGKKVSDLPEYEKRYFDSKLHDWLQLEAQKEKARSAKEQAMTYRELAKLIQEGLTQEQQDMDISIKGSSQQR